MLRLSDCGVGFCFVSGSFKRCGGSSIVRGFCSRIRWVSGLISTTFVSAIGFWC